MVGVRGRGCVGLGLVGWGAGAGNMLFLVPSITMVQQQRRPKGADASSEYATC